MAIEQSEKLTDFLAHYGVKGMKWGVRRESSSANQDAKELAVRAALTSTVNARNRVAIHETMAEHGPKAYEELSKRAQEVNDLPKFKGKDLGEDPALAGQYFDRIEGLHRELETSLKKRAYSAGVDTLIDKMNKDFGSEDPAKPLYKQKQPWDAEDNQRKLDAAREAVSASDAAYKELVGKNYQSKIDEAWRKHVAVVNNPSAPNPLNQMISEGKAADKDKTEATHAEELDSFLAHHGVKGMKWGVRRDRGSGAGKERRKSASADDDPPAKSKKSVAPEKNELSKYSDDKLTSMTAKLKGLDALSDAELSKLTKRMQLEQTYKDLQSKIPKEKSKFESFLNRAELVGESANKLVEFYDSPAGQIIKKKLGGKKASAVATAAAAVATAADKK